jgi:transcriptional regulator with XRE-family HTH domain
MAKPLPPKTPRPVDSHVGARIRLRRGMIGMTQEVLGRKLGITFQQVQKYEKGANRVGASRLQQIAEALGVTPAWFFENAPTQSGGKAKRVDDDLNRFVAGKYSAPLMRNFVKLPPDTQRAIVNLTASLSGEDDAG